MNVNTCTELRVGWKEPGHLQTLSRKWKSQRVVKQDSKNCPERLQTVFDRLENRLEWFEKIWLDLMKFDSIWQNLTKFDRIW